MRIQIAGRVIVTEREQLIQAVMNREKMRGYVITGDDGGEDLQLKMV